MNRNRMLGLGLMVALLALLVVPAAAQEEGNIILRSTFGSGPINFNPVTSSSRTDQDVMNLLYPNLLGVDPVTGVITPGAFGGMASDWEISDDGTVYTFTLREGFTWSDGVPVTANDFEYTWDAIASGETESPLAFLLDNPIVDMEAVDDYTLAVTFTSADCEALNNAGIQPLPSHVFAGQPFSALNDYDATTTDALEIGP
jgi:ABC-type transport system substrate-binding protein